MPPRHSLVVYTLSDSPFYRLRSRKKLADLLRISEAALGVLGVRSDLY